jgi:hypothetical protein
MHDRLRSYDIGSSEYMRLWRFVAPTPVPVLLPIDANHLPSPPELSVHVHLNAGQRAAP